MERMRQTKKRKNQEDNGGGMKDRRKRRSGIDAVEFLKEKCKRERMDLHDMEIEVKSEERNSRIRITNFKLW